jgi:hypothetical protein
MTLMPFRGWRLASEAGRLPALDLCNQKPAEHLTEGQESDEGEEPEWTGRGA